MPLKTKHFLVFCLRNETNFHATKLFQSLVLISAQLESINDDPRHHDLWAASRIESCKLNDAVYDFKLLRFGRVVASRIVR